MMAEMTEAADESESFEGFYRRRWQDAARWATALCGERALGEELAQEAFIASSSGSPYSTTRRATYGARIKGELEAADARIRKFYGGPMCLVPSARTLADLQRIQDEINAEWQDEMSSTGQDIVASQIDVELFVPNPELEQELADRYRDAVSVTVTGLIPISPGEDPDPGPGSVPPTPAPVPSDTAVPSRYPGRVEAAVTVSER